MANMKTINKNIETIKDSIEHMRSFNDVDLIKRLSSLDYDTLREYVYSFSSSVILPSKKISNVYLRDFEKYGVRFFLAPGFTLSGGKKGHRTRLTHPCWFSSKKEIQVLSVREAMLRYPLYMIWVYDNLSINWSVYCIANFEHIKRKFGHVNK